MRIIFLFLFLCSAMVPRSISLLQRTTGSAIPVPPRPARINISFVFCPVVFKRSQSPAHATLLMFMAMFSCHRNIGLCLQAFAHCVFCYCVYSNCPSHSPNALRLDRAICRSYVSPGERQPELDTPVLVLTAKSHARSLVGGTQKLDWGALLPIWILDRRLSLFLLSPRGNTRSGSQLLSRLQGRSGGRGRT